MTRLARVPGSACVLAWSLGEGDLLPGGERVVSVARDPAHDLVTVTVDDGSLPRRYARADRVVIAGRAVADAGRPGWRVASFLAAGRRATPAATRPAGRPLTAGGGWCER